MIIHRVTTHARNGKTAEVIAILKEIASRPGHPLVRVTTPVAGQFNTVVWDLEHESLAAQQAFGENWMAQPETAAFLEHWNTLVESDGGTEILRVE